MRHEDLRVRGKRVSWPHSKLIMTIVVIAGVVGCESEGVLDVNKVDPNSVWVDYRGDWSEEDNERHVGLAVQFRFKGPEGQIIRLTGGSKVTLAPQGINLAETSESVFGFDGASYAVSIPVGLLEEGAVSATNPTLGFAWTQPQMKVTSQEAGESGSKAVFSERSFQVVWQDPSGAEVSHQVRVASAPQIVFEGLPLVINRNTGLAFRFKNEDLGNHSDLLSEDVVCRLRTLSSTSAQPVPEPTVPPDAIGEPLPSAPPPPAVREVVTSGKRNGGCSFTPESLRGFQLGPADLVVSAQSERPGPSQLAGRSRSLSRSVGKAIGFTVVDQ